MCIIMAEKSQNKWCFVPECKNTSKNSNKIFVTVPYREERRLNWFKAVGREITASKTVFFCCEDHFILEEDLVNYVRFKLVAGSMILKPDVVPHIFKCREERKRTWEGAYITALKLARRKLAQDAMNGCAFSEERLKTVKKEFDNEDVSSSNVWISNIPDVQACTDYSCTTSPIPMKNVITDSTVIKEECSIDYFKNEHIKTEPYFESKTECNKSVGVQTEHQNLDHTET